MPADDNAPEWTPLGEAVRRWFPALAAVGGLVVGVMVGVVSHSWIAGSVGAVALAGAMVFGFYVPPLRGWPDKRDKR